MWSEDDKALDTAIGEVARQLTGGAPVPTFRAHVLKRIREREHDRAGWRMGWGLSPVAIAAAVVLVLIVRTAWQAPPAPNAQRSTPEAQRPTIDAPPPTLDAQGSTRDATVPTRNGRGSVSNRQRSSPRRAGGASPSPIDALAPERLAAAPIMIDALGRGESIQLSEMTIPSLDVRPLTELGIRNPEP